MAAYRVVLALAALAFVTPAVAAHEPIGPGARCQEDDPCWNWATMGHHHQRGIVTMHGTPMVVGPCRFRKLMHSGMVDYRTSDVMLGDFTAMRKRCR